MKKQKKFYLILDNIRSLHNVGSCFRTADGLGFEKIFLCGYTPAPIDGRQKLVIHKTALGAEESIQWEHYKKTGALLDKLKKQKFYIIALEIEKNAENIKKLKLPKTKQDIALIFGNEVRGLSKTILNKCDKIVKIPMLGQKKSYNISVSFGIAGFWIKNAS